MKYKTFENKIIGRFEKGEEIVQSIIEVCTKENIKLGKITAIGATDKVSIGHFSLKTKEYKTKEFEGDFEILNISGNITEMNGKVYLHPHITLGTKDYQAIGGHLNYAYVSATCEFIIEKYEGKLDRYKDENIGLNLLNF